MAGVDTEVAGYAISGRLPFAAVVVVLVTAASVAQTIRALLTLYREYRVSIAGTFLSGVL